MARTWELKMMKDTIRIWSLTLSLPGSLALAGCGEDSVSNSTERDAGVEPADVGATDATDAAQDARNDETDAENDLRDVDAASDTGSMSPLITVFTVDGASSTTVDEGVQVQVSWASVNTDGCTAGGTLASWSALGSLASSDTVSLETSGLENGDYTLTLECSSSEGSVSAPNGPLTVTVENSSSCANRPPVSLTRATSIVANEDDDAFFFESVFRPFPGSGFSKPIRMRNTRYAAMEFKTDSSIEPDALGAVETAVLQPAYPNTTSTLASRLWSISRCPGDFRTHSIDPEMGPGCVKGGLTLSGQAHFRFGGSDYRTDPNVCALEPSTTYFLNLIYSNQDPPTTEQEHEAITSTCPTEFCGNGMVPNGQGF